MRLHYDTDKLMSNGLEVTALTVVGKLVEIMFVISRSAGINFGGVAEKDLPDCVSLTLDGRRGEHEVQCYEADRALAIRVGRLIRSKLQSCMLEVVHACVEVRARGKRVGEHDLICEVVGGRGSEQIRQYLSVEIKLRMLYSDEGLLKVRKNHRKELCDDLAWWPAEKDKYCGRLILLGRFSRKPADKFNAGHYHLNAFVLCGDLRMKGEVSFRGIFGWGDRLPEITWVAPVVSVPKVLPPAPKRKLESASAPVSKSTSTTPAAARSQGSGITNQGKVDELKFPGGFCEVKLFLKAIKKNTSKASYWSKKAQARHSWAETDLKQAPRNLDTSGGGEKRKRAGGVPEWLASKKVLKQMCIDFF